MTAKTIYSASWVGCALWAMLLGILTGCIVQPVGGGAYVAPVVVQPAAVVVDDGLIYYPNYEVYYDPGVHVYWYARGGGWVRGPAPEGVSVNVLLASPSVRMNFRDSPANHHAEVIRQYPRNWRPAERGRERGEN